MSLNEENWRAALADADASQAPRADTAVMWLPRTLGNASTHELESVRHRLDMLSALLETEIAARYDAPPEERA